MMHSGGASRQSLWQGSSVTSPVVFYAGAHDNNPYPDSAGDCYFGVLQDGSVYAQAIKIMGGSIALGSGDNSAQITTAGAQFGLQWSRTKITYSNLNGTWSDWDYSGTTGLNNWYLGHIPDYWGVGMPSCGLRADLDVSDCTDFSIGVSNGGSTFGYAGITFHMNASDNNCYATLSGTWRGSLTASSDRNLKNSIEDLSDKYSAFFDRLNPVRFKLNDGTSGRYHTGFIAQDVETALEQVGLSTNEAALFVRFVTDNPKNNTTEITYGLRYIDGTKIEANANKYTWVWKKSCIKNRNKVFAKLTELIHEINNGILSFLGVRIETREEYAVEYLEEVVHKFSGLTGTDGTYICGRGHHKTEEQRQYDKLCEYLGRLKKYAENIEICGEIRNSYSKTDRDATFMRVKRDYMGNDQLLPAYNMQIGVCDEYIAVVDAKQYASDMDCFVPLMDKFKSAYGMYPNYPVADAGYGSYNNYLFCEQNGIEKYMKFTMFEKETKDPKYRDNPYRAVNFKCDEDGHLICPEGRKFEHLYDSHVRGNRYGRTEEVYKCESCEGCPRKSECSKASGDRTVRLNRELTQIHTEVLNNLKSELGITLRTNRSIQAEGVFGSIKWNRSYKRAQRRGIESIILEFTLISIGFNLYKYFNKKMRLAKIA